MAYRTRQRVISDLLPPKYVFREAEVPFRFNQEYEKWRDLFTIMMHAMGKFKFFRGVRSYVGGWIKCVDNISKDNVSMLLLCDIADELGLWGACWFYYKKPFTTVGDEVVRLKYNADLEEFVKWVPAVRVMDVYVTHPKNDKVISDILGDMYWSLRRLWPRPVIEEIDETDLGIPLLEWYPVEEAVEEAVEETVKETVGETLEETVGDTLEETVGDTVEEIVGDTVDLVAP